MIYTIPNTELSFILNDEIIALIARRMELSNQLGVLKKEMNLNAYQPERWREIIASKTHTAALKGLDPSRFACLIIQ